MPNSFVKYFPDVKKRSILYTGPPTTVIILLLVYTVHTYSVYCPDIVVWYIDRHLFCSGHKSVFYTNIYLQIVICLLPPTPSCSSCRLVTRWGYQHLCEMFLKIANVKICNNFRLYSEKKPPVVHWISPLSYPPKTPGFRWKPPSCLLKTPSLFIEPSTENSLLWHYVLLQLERYPAWRNIKKNTKHFVIFRKKITKVFQQKFIFTIIHTVQYSK